MIDYRKVWEKEAREEGLAEGRTLGLEEGHSLGLAEGKIHTLFSMYNNGVLTYDTILSDYCESESDKTAFINMVKNSTQ